MTLVPATRYDVPSVNLVSDPDRPRAAVIEPDAMTSPPNSEAPKEFPTDFDPIDPLTNRKLSVPTDVTKPAEKEPA